MSLFAYSGPPTRSGMGRAQVMLSVDEIAREKSAFGTKSLGEASDREIILSAIYECNEGAIVRYRYFSNPVLGRDWWTMAWVYEC